MQTRSTFDAFERARKHPIACDKPAPDFFEGALLGNGGLGVVVCTRPDAVVLHFGHNDVWDIRLAEKNQEKIGTFQEVFEKVKAIPTSRRMLTEDAWFKEYCEMSRKNYAKPYPRPFPCGSVVLGFDRREAELLGHRLDVSVGLCEIRFLVARKIGLLQVFSHMKADPGWLRMGSAAGNPIASPLERVRLLPDPETPKELPAFTVPKKLRPDALAFRQVL